MATKNVNSPTANLFAILSEEPSSKSKPANKANAKGAKGIEETPKQKADARAKIQAEAKRIADAEKKRQADLQAARAAMFVEGDGDFKSQRHQTKVQRQQDAKKAPAESNNKDWGNKNRGNNNNYKGNNNNQGGDRNNDKRQFDRRSGAHSGARGGKFGGNQKKGGAGKGNWGEEPTENPAAPVEEVIAENEVDTDALWDAVPEEAIGNAFDEAVEEGAAAEEGSFAAGEYEGEFEEEVFVPVVEYTLEEYAEQKAAKLAELEEKLGSSHSKQTRELTAEEKKGLASFTVVENTKGKRQAQPKSEGEQQAQKTKSNASARKGTKSAAVHDIFSVKVAGGRGGGGRGRGGRGRGRGRGGRGGNRGGRGGNRDNYNNNQDYDNDNKGYQNNNNNQGNNRRDNAKVVGAHFPALGQ